MQWGIDRYNESRNFGSAVNVLMKFKAIDNLSQNCKKGTSTNKYK